MIPVPAAVVKSIKNAAAEMFNKIQLLHFFNKCLLDFGCFYPIF